jgi:AraC-like DNA-binding protein
VSVADVAVAVSLPHQGRFSAAYRERFGELPSDTLARTRRTADGEGPGAGAGLDEADRARASVEEGCSPKRSRS